MTLDLIGSFLPPLEGGGGAGGGQVGRHTEFALCLAWTMHARTSLDLFDQIKQL